MSYWRTVSRIPRGLARLGAALLVFVIGLIGVGVATATPAAAESSTTLTAQYPWPHNGCTGVSDTVMGVSFTYACNHHDGCYGGHWATRATYDQWFFNDMKNACTRLPFEMIGGYVAWAGCILKP
jgi:hypothetical protein